MRGLAEVSLSGSCPPSPLTVASSAMCSGPAPAPAQSPVAVPVEAVSEAQIQAFLGGLDYG